MYIVIAGAGMVGGDLARMLLEKKHDVVVIDQKKEVCDKLYSKTGVIAINGSSARIEVLKEANVEKADVLIAATVSDADNLACAILAKSFDVPQIIVRMRNPAYENAYKVAGANTIVRVTDLMVNQIMMEIDRPKARKITAVGEGRAYIFEVVVPENAKIAGNSVKDIAESPGFPSQCVFTGVYNKSREKFSIPRGNHVINEGDELFLVSTAQNIKKAVDFLIEKKVT